MSMTTIVALIIAVFVLILILTYVFTAEGGPKSLIDAILNFFGNQTSYVEATSNI